MDPLEELKRRRQSALTKQADPLAELVRRKNLSQDTALSPLLPDDPFAVERPSLPVGGPRASRPLPTITTTADAPGAFTKKIAQGIRAENRRSEPFVQNDVLSPEQERQVQRAQAARAIAEDVGKAFVGQPERTALRTATGAQRLLGNDRAADALGKRLAKVEEATAPQTGIGVVPRLAAEIGAFLPSGLAGSALRSGLEGAAGAESSTASMASRAITGKDIENPFVRGAADAALDMALPGAIAGYRGARALRSARNELGDAFARGLGEGASEGAGALTPTMPTRETRTILRQPVDPTRALPERAGTLPAGTPTLQGPAIPTGPVRTPETRPDRLLAPSTGPAIPANAPGGALPDIGDVGPMGPAIPTRGGMVGPQGPVSSLLRALPAQTVGERQRLFMMPPIREAVEQASRAINATPTRQSRRIPAAEALERRPAFEQAMPEPATADDVATYTARRTPLDAALRAAEERAIRRINAEEAIGTPAQQRERLIQRGRLRRPETAPTAPLPDEVLERGAREAAGEVEPIRGGERPPEVPDEPIDVILNRLDDAEYERTMRETRADEAAAFHPDGTPRLTDAELDDVDRLAASVRKRIGAKRPLTQASDRELETLLSAARRKFGELNATVQSWREHPVWLAIEEGSTGKSAVQTARLGKSPVSGNRLTTKAELRSRYGNLSEEQVGRLAEIGWSPEDFFAKNTEVNRLRLALTNVEKSLAKFEAEAARRAGGAVGSPVERSGFASPSVLSAVGGGGTGALAGALSADREEGESPLLRALAGAAAGAAAGGAIGARLTRSPKAATSIPELDPVMGTINTGKRAQTPAAPGILSAGQRLYNSLISETKVLLETAKRFGGTADETKVANAIAKKHGQGQSAKQYLFDNLTPILQSLSDAEQNSLRALLKARRDLQIRMNGGGAKSAVDTQALDAAVQAGNADPKIATAADAITQIHRDLLKMRHDAGLLTDEAYQAILASDDYYTPLFRELAQGNAALPGSRGGRFSVKSSGVRRMDRTLDALENTADPLEMVAQDVARTYRDVAKQRVANVIFDLADTPVNSLSQFIKRVPSNPAAPPTRDGIIQQVRNGKLYTYEVTDKDLYRALSNMDQTTQNAFATVAQALKNIKTAGITRLPDFAIANAIRDVAMSGAQRPDVRRAMVEGAGGALVGGTSNALAGDEDDSTITRFLAGAGVGVGVGLYSRPMAQTIKAMGEIVGNTEIYRQFLRDGGSTEGFYVRNADDAVKLLKEVKHGPGFKASDILIPTNWWETLGKIGSVAEQSTRLAAYKQILEAGGTAGAAIREAQDRTLRFSNIGASKTVKDFAAMTPFWNAKVQGWDKLARLIKDPKTSALGIGMLTAPSIALWSVNKDNPEYWNRPTWEKNLFWLVPKPNAEPGESQFWRIPKPFELGFLFASLPERMLDYAAQRGAELPFFGDLSGTAPQTDQAGKLLGRSAVDMATATFEGTLPIPEIVSTPAQLALDYDTFRNRRIVSNPNVSPELQDTPQSSAIARALARAGISPEKTDFAIRNVFGTAGAEASKAVDAAARELGVSAPAFEGARSIPVVGRFPERFGTNDRAQSDPEAFARNEIAKIKQLRADFNELEKRGDPAAMERYVEKHYDLLRFAAQVDDLEKELADITRTRNQLMKRRDISPDVRNDVLGMLRERGAAVGRQLMEAPR